eukprot:1324502-Rhodomonas_salina.6
MCPSLLRKFSWPASFQANLFRPPTLPSHAYASLMSEGGNSAFTSVSLISSRLQGSPNST